MSGLLNQDSRPRLLVGLILKMTNHVVVELAGHLGFDFVLIDTEHGICGGAELDNHLRAAGAAHIPAIVRSTVWRAQPDYAGLHAAGSTVLEHARATATPVFVIDDDAAGRRWAGRGGPRPTSQLALRRLTEPVHLKESHRRLEKEHPDDH